MASPARSRRPKRLSARLSRRPECSPATPARRNVRSQVSLEHASASSSASVSPAKTRTAQAIPKRNGSPNGTRSFFGFSPTTPAETSDNGKDSLAASTWRQGCPAIRGALQVAFLAWRRMGTPCQRKGQRPRHMAAMAENPQCPTRQGQKLRSNDFYDLHAVGLKSGEKGATLGWAVGGIQ